MKFLRLLAKTCAAQDIGQDAFCLLTVVVTLEDVARYRRGITFYNEQLAPILGFTRWHRLDAARKTAVAAGWLHYEPSPIGRRQAGTYWVLIPEHANDLPDGTCDEGEQSTESVECKYVHSTETVERQSTESVERPVERPVELSSLSLSLNPNKNIPYISSCPGSAADEQPGKGAKAKSSKRKQTSFTDEDTATAQWLWQAILAMQPGRQAPNLDQWANTVRLMRERDGRTDAQIRDLFARVQRDSFWRVNVLSPEKLREKWDDLTLRLQENANGTKQPNGRRAPADRCGPGVRYDPAARIGEGF
jgi:hypothetical protein